MLNKQTKPVLCAWALLFLAYQPLASNAQTYKTYREYFENTLPINSTYQEICSKFKCLKTYYRYLYEIESPAGDNIFPYSFQKVQLFFSPTGILYRKRYFGDWQREFDSIKKEYQTRSYDPANPEGISNPYYVNVSGRMWGDIHIITKNTYQNTDYRIDLYKLDRLSHDRYRVLFDIAGYKKAAEELQTYIQNHEEFQIKPPFKGITLGITTVSEAKKQSKCKKSKFGSYICTNKNKQYKYEISGTDSDIIQYIKLLEVLKPTSVKDIWEKANPTAETETYDTSDTESINPSNLDLDIPYPIKNKEEWVLSPLGIGDFGQIDTLYKTATGPEIISRAMLFNRGASQLRQKMDDDYKKQKLKEEELIRQQQTKNKLLKENGFVK